jgi:hypothetical protein
VRVHEVTLSSVEGKRKGGSFQAHSGASSSTPTPRSGPSPSTVTPPSHLLRRVWLYLLGLFRLKFGRQFGISTETQASTMSELLGMRKA